MFCQDAQGCSGEMRCGKSTSSPTNDGDGKIVSGNEDQKLERLDDC
jgi:hypothetical protein